MDLIIAVVSGVLLGAALVLGAVLLVQRYADVHRDLDREAETERFNTQIGVEEERRHREQRMEREAAQRTAWVDDRLSSFMSALRIVDMLKNDLATEVTLRTANDHDYLIAEQTAQRLTGLQDRLVSSVIEIELLAAPETAAVAARVQSAVRSAKSACEWPEVLPLVQLQRAQGELDQAAADFRRLVHGEIARLGIRLSTHAAAPGPPDESGARPAPEAPEAAEQQVPRRADDREDAETETSAAARAPASARPDSKAAEPAPRQSV